MRALLTETERAVLSGESNPTANYVATVRSRLRTRIDELDRDVAVLSDHEPELLTEVQAVVCEASTDGRE
jgi:hypothetical protein